MKKAEELYHSEQVENANGDFLSKIVHYTLIHEPKDQKRTVTAFLILVVCCCYCLFSFLSNVRNAFSFHVLSPYETIRMTMKWCWWLMFSGVSL